MSEDSLFCSCCGERVAPATPVNSFYGGFFSAAGSLDGSENTREASCGSLETKKASSTSALRISNLLGPNVDANGPRANVAGATSVPGSSNVSDSSRLTGSSTSSVMKKHCIQCGAELKEDSQICAVCGKTANATAGYSAKSEKGTPTKRKYLIVGISIAVCLVLLVSLAVLSPIVRINDSGSGQEKLSTNQEAEAPTIDTAYPDAVSTSARSTITVEIAEADLRETCHHECLENGIVTFDEKTYEYPSLTSMHIIYWFDISVPWEYGTENYRAKVTYYLTDNEEELKLSKAYDACEIWQVDHQFTKLGIWQYDDGETSVWINFIERDGNAYVVEYEISYCAHYWSSSEQITYSTNGRKNVYGDNEWNGNTYYLSIDLGDIRHEDGSTSSLGYIKVYPWSGVYWNALHVYGGPYELHN